MAALEWMIQHGERAGAAMVLAAAVAAAWLPRAWLLRSVRRRARGAWPEVRGGVRREGEPVVIEGTLHVVTDPCARFEDGAPAAAATVTVPSPPEEQGSLPAHVRAGKLVLHAHGEALPLEGPVEVRAGSREYWPMVLVSWLSASLKGRLGRVLGPAGGHVPSISPVCRSVQDSDRVRVSAAWAHQGADEATSYRGAAGWSLVPLRDRPGSKGTIQVSAARVREVVGPNPLALVGLAVLGALAGGQALRAGGQAALSPRFDRPELALLTPLRGQALDALARRIDSDRWMTRPQIERAEALHAARGDCRAQGWALYRHSALDEAADRWSRCPGSEARWLAASALYELTEWERASDLIADLSPSDNPTSAEWYSRYRFGLAVHLLAGRLDRANLLDRGHMWSKAGPPCYRLQIEAKLGVERAVEHLRWWRCRAETLDMQDPAARTRPESSSPLPEAAELLLAEGAQGPLRALPSPRVAQADLLTFALRPSELGLSWPVALLLSTAPRIAEPRGAGRQDDDGGAALHALASQAERLALYSVLAGRDDDARSWAQRARAADEQLAPLVAPGPLGRPNDSGGELVELIVALDSDRFEQAEQLSWSVHHQGLRNLAPLLVGHGQNWEVLFAGLDEHDLDLCWFEPSHTSPRGTQIELPHAVADGVRLAEWYGCARARPLALLPRLAPRVRSDAEAALAVYQGGPRVMRPRTLLDLLAEAHDEIMLRRRLGLPDPDNRARRRQKRIDDKLRDRDLAVLLPSIEASSR